MRIDSFTPNKCHSIFLNRAFCFTLIFHTVSHSVSVERSLDFALFLIILWLFDGTQQYFTRIRSIERFYTENGIINSFQKIIWNTRSCCVQSCGGPVCMIRCRVCSLYTHFYNNSIQCECIRPKIEIMNENNI